MSSTESKAASRDGAAEEMRALVEGLDVAALGTALSATIKELYPICRSITGDGLRASLRILQRIVPLTLHEVPSGTQVFDCVVPREWNLRSARLLGPDGTVLVDTANSSLHVLNYSVPFKESVSLEELEPHLYSLPEAPSLIPYRTSYYKDAWGFCLSHTEWLRLRPGKYQVDIDTTLENGALTYGEFVVPGETDAEVLVSTHCCHPSLANDNCAGMAMCATLARLLSTLKPRYTYRFVFVPGTVGAITWLAQNEAQARRVAHGLVAACVGDKGRLTYRRSRRGTALIDRAAVHVLSHTGEDFEVRDFTPYGYDERQYCSPGFNLAVGSHPHPVWRVPRVPHLRGQPGAGEGGESRRHAAPLPRSLRGAGGQPHVHQPLAKVRAAAGQARPLRHGGRTEPCPGAANGHAVGTQPE